jgi:hypothetical protein
VDKPAHPFQLWLDLMSMDYVSAANRCRELGREVAAEYLKQIARGWYGPSYDLAKFIACELCENAISVSQLKDFPYSSRGHKGEAA